MKGKTVKLSGRISALALAFASFSHASVADDHAPLTLASPSGNIKVTVNTENGVSYQVAFNGKQIIAPSQIDLTKHTKFGSNASGV